MALKKKERKTLKGYFETGDRPTEEDFIELIDSMVIKDEDSINYESNGTTISELNIGDKDEEEPTGSLNVYGDAKVSKTMHVGADLTIKGDLEVKGKMLVKQTEVHEGNVQLGDEDTDRIKIIGYLQAADLDTPLKMKSPMLFEKNVGINTTLTVNGKVHTKGNLDVNKELTAGEKITTPNLTVTNLLQAKDATISGTLKVGNENIVDKINDVDNAKVNRSGDTIKGNLIIAKNGDGEGGDLRVADEIRAKKLKLSSSQIETKAKLYVEGEARITSSLNIGNSLDMNGKLALTRTLNDGKATLSHGQSDEWNNQTFYTESIKRMTINSDGNVGIGVANPTEKLDVNGTIKATAFEGNGSNLSNITSASIIGSLLASHIPPLDTSKITTGVFDKLHIPPEFNAKQIKAVDTTGLKLYDSKSRGIIIKDGNVGIGTASPSEKLHVKGAVLATSFKGNGGDLTNIKASAITGTIKSAQIHDELELKTITATSTVGLKLHDNTDTGILIKDGKVGIGTSTPAKKLEVNGTIRANKFELPDGTDISSIGGLWEENEDHLYYEKGRIGIGTTTPNTQLDVIGAIRADRFELQSRVVRRWTAIGLQSTGNQLISWSEYAITLNQKSSRAIFSPQLPIKSVMTNFRIQIAKANEQTGNTFICKLRKARYTSPYSIITLAQIEVSGKSSSTGIYQTNEIKETFVEPDCAYWIECTQTANMETSVYNVSIKYEQLEIE